MIGRIIELEKENTIIKERLKNLEGKLYWHENNFNAHKI